MEWVNFYIREVGTSIVVANLIVMSAVIRKTAGAVRRCSESFVTVATSAIKGAGTVVIMTGRRLSSFAMDMEKEEKVKKRVFGPFTGPDLRPQASHDSKMSEITVTTTIETVLKRATEEAEEAGSAVWAVSAGVPADEEQGVGIPYEPFRSFVAPWEGSPSPVAPLTKSALLKSSPF